jgi:hypothetical protein
MTPRHIWVVKLSQYFENPLKKVGLEQFVHFKHLEVHREDLIKVSIRLENVKIFLDVESSNDLDRHTVRTKAGFKNSHTIRGHDGGSFTADAQMV